MLVISGKRIDTWPPTSGAQPEVPFVIVPSIFGVRTDFSPYIEELTFTRNLTRTIIYVISIFNAKGLQIDSWTVHATGTGTLFSSHETFSTSALRDGAAQLLTGLRERPEIKARLPEEDSVPVKEAAESWARNPGIAILPSGLTGESWAKCVKDALSGGPVPFVEAERFRDAVFPWFEPTVLPASEAGAWRMKDPLVGAGAMEVGARYILLVRGDTAHGSQTGPFLCGGGAGGGGGCFGVTSATRHSSLNLTLGDFMRGEIVGKIEASASGSFTWFAFIIPIPVISATETEACQEAAAKVRQLLSDR